jgi:hypothetical protein
MKSQHFKHTILFIIFGISLMGKLVQAQTAYEERVTKYKDKWQHLIPSYYKTQFAGGMGLISVGTGWDYGKNNQWETDVFLGFLPKYSTDRSKVTFTLKQNFIPWEIHVNHRLSINPLTCGVYLNTIFGSQYWATEPDKYPDNYYSFSTKMRFYVFAGQRFTWNINPRKRLYAKSLSFFYELNTNDLYLASAIPNNYLSARDIIKLSLGIKMQVF